MNRIEEIPYFFKELDKPLLLEEVFLQSYLQYLQDNVRKSEDYGGDNHIYLYYDNEDMLSLILQWGNLSSILQDKKFIFLIGREQKNNYPIDFKEQFGIEYLEENKKPIQLEELNRICYWYKHPYSGNDFGRELLGISPYIQEIKGQDFHIYSMKHNQMLWGLESFRSIIKNPKQILSFEQLKSFNSENGYELYFKEYDVFLEWLEKRVEKEEVSVIELFKGYFLYHYEKREENPRIAPMLLWDLHMTENNVYEEIVKEFTYKIVLTAMRDPIIVLARAYDFGLIGWNELQTKYFLASTYLHGQFLSEEFDSVHFAYCFENLKMYPQEQLKALCKVLNVPFEESMLQAKIPMVHNNGEVVEGFDLKPLKRKIDQQLSDFDQMRLKIYYEPILKYYGYDTFDLEEYPLPINEVVQLFRYPFRFERQNQEKFGEFAPSEEELRKWIYDIMLKTYYDYRMGKKIRFPKLVSIESTIQNQNCSDRK